MNYKGKRVKVAFYHFFEDKPYKIVEGKVKKIHKARGIRDTSTIEIIDDNGKTHTGGYKNYFTIIKTIKRRGK